MLDEVGRREVVDVAVVDERDRLGERGAELAVGDEVLLLHELERADLALASELHAVRGRIFRRRCDEPGEHRGLGDREVFDLLAEVCLRGRADAVRAVPEIDVVEIDRQDVGLGQLALEPNRADDLAHLPPSLEALLLDGELVGRVRRRILDVFVAGEQRLLDDLLGDRRATLLDVIRAHVFDGRAQDADEVEALVLVEPAILGGDERGRHVRRHALELDDLAVLDRERTDLLAVRRQHDALAVRLVVEELGEILRQLVVDLVDREVQGRRGERRTIEPEQRRQPERRHQTETAPAPAANRAPCEEHHEQARREREHAEVLVEPVGRPRVEHPDLLRIFEQDRARADADQARDPGDEDDKAADELTPRTQQLRAACVSVRVRGRIGHGRL